MRKIIEITAGKPIYGGKTLSELNGKKVILEKALPGERVIAYIKKTRRGHIEAVAERILERSPYRIDQDCPYYHVCGGCKLRDVGYDYQTSLKRIAVKDCIERIGKVSDCDILPIIQSPELNGYRNKTEFTFSKLRYVTDPAQRDQEESFTLGFHAPKVFSKSIDIDECKIQPELMNKVYLSIKNKLKSSKLEPYDVVRHEGFLRYLVIRKSCSNDIMINLVTKNENHEILKIIAEEIAGEYYQVKSFLNTINKGLATTAYGERTSVLFGSENIIDSIGRFNFELSHNSFFQTNPHQTPALYDTVIEFASFDGSENVLDLYCGAGTISIYISDRVKSVTGFELVDNAVADARKNAEINGINNCTFYAGDMMRLAADDKLFSKEYDIVVTDPPRDGMHRKVVSALISSGIERIVYVSCNPSTFARDVELLVSGGYNLKKVRPVDMFPHTYHIEVVGLLEKN